MLLLVVASSSLLWVRAAASTGERPRPLGVHPARAASPSRRSRRRPGSATRSTRSSWRGSKQRGLPPAPEADRPTLLRRLTLRPDRPAADAGGARGVRRRPIAAGATSGWSIACWRVPHYGERWAQHWLDLARFAETDGFEFDQARPDAWRYRDWVVRALNRDMPYDRFVRLQLAGDELAARRSGGLHRHRVQPLLSRHGRPQRPGTAAPECA